MLGLYALALAGIGIAFGGLVTTAFAGEIIALLVILTFVIDTVVPALKLPDWIQQLALTAHLGHPMVGAVGLAGDGAARRDRGGRAPARDLGRERGATSSADPDLVRRTRRRAPARRRSMSGPPRPRPRLALVDSAALVAIAIAAVLHAAWNILLKTAGDPLRTATAGVVASSLILIPLVALGWLAFGQPSIPPEAWLIGTISGAVEVAYFVFLAAAYRRGDLSVVYPLARGTAPLLAVAIGRRRARRAARAGGLARRRPPRRRAARRPAAVAAARAARRHATTGSRPASRS